MAPPDLTPPDSENLKQPRPINPAARKPSFPLNSPHPPGPALPAIPSMQAYPSTASLQDPPNNEFIPPTHPAPLQPPVSIGPPDPTRPMGDLSYPFAAQVPPPPALYKDPKRAPAPLYQHTIPSQRQHSQLREDAIRAQEEIAQTQAAIQALSQTTAIRTAAIHAAALQSGAFQAQAPQETSGYTALGLQGQGSPLIGPQYPPNAFGSLRESNIQPQPVHLPTYYGPPPNPAGHPEGEVTIKHQLVNGDPNVGPNGLKYGQVPSLYPPVAKRTSPRKRTSPPKRKPST